MVRDIGYEGFVDLQHEIIGSEDFAVEVHGFHGLGDDAGFSVVEGFFADLVVIEAIDFGELARCVEKVCHPPDKTSADDDHVWPRAGDRDGLDVEIHHGIMPWKYEVHELEDVGILLGGGVEDAVAGVLERLERLALGLQLGDLR